MVAGQATVAMRGGIRFISLYLRHSEGMSESNREILEAAAAFLASVSGPWVVAADWNITPQVLEQSRWPELVGGKIHTPDGPTCAAKCYDYFVVEKGLSTAVAGVVRITDAGTYPHIPTRLLIRAADCRRKIRRLVKPPYIPARLPAGPLGEAESRRRDANTTSRKCAGGGAQLEAVPQLPDVDAAAQRWTEEARRDLTGWFGPDITKRIGHYFRWEPAIKRCQLPHASFTETAVVEVNCSILVSEIQISFFSRLLTTNFTLFRSQSRCFLKFPIQRLPSRTLSRDPTPDQPFRERFAINTVLFTVLFKWSEHTLPLRFEVIVKGDSTSTPPDAGDSSPFSWATACQNLQCHHCRPLFKPK